MFFLRLHEKRRYYAGAVSYKRLRRGGHGRSGNSGVPPRCDTNTWNTTAARLNRIWFRGSYAVSETSVHAGRSEWRRRRWPRIAGKITTLQFRVCERNYERSERAIGSPRSAETDTGIFVTAPLSSYVPPFEQMSSSRPPLTRWTQRCGRATLFSLSLSLDDFHAFVI